jgi:hypothetical protein
MLTAGTHRETPENTELGINNGRKDYKMGRVCGVLVGGRGIEGDEGEGICLMHFIYKIQL